MKLKNILNGIDFDCICGDLDIKIKDIVYNSKKEVEGSIFVCLEGINFNSHDFINEAVQKGAVAVVVSREIKIEGVTVILVKNTRETLAYMSVNFFKRPSNELKTIAITGTKGKTTVSFMIKNILECCGLKVGLIGTIGLLIGDKIIKTKNTTPESYEVQKYLRLMVQEGCEYAIIEASSLGLGNHRLDGIKFNCGAFTNFSRDHISVNEHKNMEEYLSCKGILFKICERGVVNNDDKNYEKLLRGHTCSIKTYGLNKADFIAENLQLIKNFCSLGIKFDLVGTNNYTVCVNIPGKFTVYNALCAIAVCENFGIDKQYILEGLSSIKVKGRAEIIPVSLDFTLIIDYAHNADSMKHILNTLKEYSPKRLVILFGAGGDRPKSRRYEVGEAAGKIADLCVLTEDNSRFEEPIEIISDIEIGLKKTSCKYVVIPKRKDAIEYCLSEARKGDMIILAGKGHEDYIEIKGEKIPFDERSAIDEIVRRKKWKKYM